MRSWRIWAATKSDAVCKIGHALQHLLDAIEDEFREQLESAYAANPVVPGKPTLKNALAEYDTLFVKARYAFEARELMSVAGTSQGLVRLLRADCGPCEFPTEADAIR